MFREVARLKRNPFSTGFPARSKQSPRRSAGNHNRIPLSQHFQTQQQQRWQRNTTSETTNKSNLSFSKGNVPAVIKTKCSSSRKDFPFLPILGKVHKRLENFRNSEGIQISFIKDTSPEKNSSEYTPKRKSEFFSGKESKKCWRREQ